MNGILFASKLALKVLTIVGLSTVVPGVATLFIDLNAEAQSLSGLNRNTVLTGLVHSESTKPQPQTGPEQADTVAESQHTEVAAPDDAQPCAAVCLLPPVATDEE